MSKKNLPLKVSLIKTTNKPKLGLTTKLPENMQKSLSVPMTGGIPASVCMPLRKDSAPASGDYYGHDNPLETIKVMEYLSIEWTKNGLPPDMICNLLQVAKYLSPRLGRKGGRAELEKDLFKIENYAHRARTKEWLKETK